MKLGTMQGRMVPPENGRFQSFPRARWRDELPLAAKAGLETIEWIYDAYGETANPLVTDAGSWELQRLCGEHGIGIHSCCADWFMDFPLIAEDAKPREERWERLVWLLERCKSVGIGRVVIPFVDASAIKTHQDRAHVVAGLKTIRPQIDAYGVELHLETALDPTGFAALLAEIGNPMVKVNYDIGNSAALGYSPDEEFEAYGDLIGSVHVKDRMLGGGTVPLGRGDADIERVFKNLREAAYRGDFILQVARGESGEEVAWARRNLGLVRTYLDDWFLS